MIHLEELTHFLDCFFDVSSFPADQSGVYVGSIRPVQRLGLALEPWAGLGLWAAAERLDALFLHRPWQLEPEQLAEDVGVIAYHLAFDEQLTLGFNLRLADALGMRMIEQLGEKQKRRIGMIGIIESPSFERLRETLGQAFGGDDAARPPASLFVPKITCIAVVGRMNDADVREAFGRGASVYITGQERQQARSAVEETGIGVIAVGHRRSEEWGLRALAGVVRERWKDLTVVLPPEL